MRTPASDSYTKRQQPTALPEHFFNRHHKGSEMIIYKITNRINGKVYIGQTIKSLAHRWRQHCMPSEKCTCLVRAIQKYGKENFTVEQIDVASDPDELNEKEKYWIAEYDCMAPKGYNLKSGGNENIVYSDETRRRISEANTGKKASAETREKLSKAFKGRKLSEETIAKMSASRKGRARSAETRAKISQSLMGHSFTDETRQKMSEAQKRRVITDETRLKMSQSSTRKRNVICVETGEVFDSIAKASEKYKASDTHISCVCRGKRKTAGGYHWRYADAK